MAGLNTTGASDPKDYVLGRGKVYFANLYDSTVSAKENLPQDFRFLGNAPEFNVSVTVETLEHQSSRKGLKTTDKEVTVSQKVNLSLTLDELNFQNLALFFSGKTVTHTSGQNLTNQVIVPASGSGEPGVVQGRWYDIYSGTAPFTSADRLYHIIPGATVTVSESAGQLGFTVDREMGRIFVKSGGDIAAGGALTVSISGNGTSDTAVDEVQALSESAVAGALKFVSSNPGDNDHFTEYQFHKVSLKAEGDFGLISDEVTTMQLTGVAEANAAAGGADSPTLTIRTHVSANNLNV